MRIVYWLLAWLCFAIGVIGIVLPGLPTTPFMLLALWLFSKSSQRFHAWLLHHPQFGPAIRCWLQHRVIPRKAKIAAVTMMSISLVYVLVFSALTWWLQGAVVLGIGYGAYFILSKPSAVSE